MRPLPVLVVLILSLFAASAFAAELFAPRQIAVSGMAERKVTPDQAHIYANVSGLDMKLEAAKAQHDKKLKEVMSIAKNAGVDEAQIKTQHSSIQPQYTYENNKRLFKGYQVQTSLDITVKKTEKLAELVDKLSSAKLEAGNPNEWQNFLSVNYTIGEPDKIRDEMLTDAIKNARSKAERMAAAADAKIGRVLAINEGGSPNFVFPPMPMARGGVMAMKAEAADAVAPPPGEQQVNANVTVTFELKD